jgi:uncharacterized protein
MNDCGDICHPTWSPAGDMVVFNHDNCGPRPKSNGSHTYRARRNSTSDVDRPHCFGPDSASDTNGDREPAVASGNAGWANPRRLWDDASVGGLPPHPVLPPAGWYHDGTTVRWWDGTSWGPVAPPGSFESVPADPVRDGSTLAVLCHIGQIVGAVVLALVIRLTEGKRNEYVRHHSSEALNFQLTFLIIWIGGIFATIGGAVAFGDTADGDGSPSILLPFLALLAVFGVALVFAIIGAVSASRGQWWRYPISIRFVRGARAKGNSTSAT